MFNVCFWFIVEWDEGVFLLICGSFLLFRVEIFGVWILDFSGVVDVVGWDVEDGVVGVEVVEDFDVGWVGGDLVREVDFGGWVVVYGFVDDVLKVGEFFDLFEGWDGYVVGNGGV